MCRAALRKVLAGLVETQLPVHSQAHFGGVIVLLAIVLPPADWAQRQGAGLLQRLVAAAWAAKTIFHGVPRMNGRKPGVAGLHEEQLLAISLQLLAVAVRSVQAAPEGCPPGKGG